MTAKIADPEPPKSTYVGTITRSSHWQSYMAREGDVIVTTPAKSGTTWTQAILALLFSGDPLVNANPSENAPWFDAGFSDPEENMKTLNAQAGRRQVKSHTPIDGIPMWPDLRYICVYRHPIDAHFSARKHVANYMPDVRRDRGISDDNFPDDPRESFRIFLTSDEPEDHGTLKVLVNHYVKCLKTEPRENLLRLHYADMTRDLAKAVRQVADHVDINLSPTVMKSLVEAAQFGNMKANSDRFALAPGKGVWNSDAGFFDSATSNKWEGVLTEEDLADYDAAISKLLTPTQRHWLEWGSV